MYGGSRVLFGYAGDGRGVGIAHFNLATPDGNTAEIWSLTAHILLHNLKTKPIWNYLKRGTRLHPDGFLIEIILRIWFKQVLNFFICCPKITCKPMGSLAKKFNLGPPPPICIPCQWHKLCFFQLILLSIKGLNMLATNWDFKISQEPLNYALTWFHLEHWIYHNYNIINIKIF